MHYIIDFITTQKEETICFEFGSLEAKEELEKQFLCPLLHMLSADTKEGVFITRAQKPSIENLVVFLSRFKKDFPNIGSSIAMLNKLEENNYFAIAINKRLDAIHHQHLLCRMRELETGESAEESFREFMNHNGALYQYYRPYSIDRDVLVRFGPQEKRKRVCRYCGKSIPDVTFNSKAHTIPQALGNKTYITNDECDECNRKFGNTIEQDILDFVSVYRTLSGIYEGTPCYETRKEGFNFSVSKDHPAFNVTAKKILRVRESIENISVDLDGGKSNIENVYRALCKFVIGMLPHEELANFEHTIEWINGRNLASLPHIKWTRFKYPEEQPFINMFFRRKDDSSLPYLVAEFHVFHVELLYVVPGCKQDKDIKNDILDDILKIRNDENKWITYDITPGKPQDMIFTVNIPRNKHNESPQ